MSQRLCSEQAESSRRIGTVCTNKILWVERQPSNSPTALGIHAQLLHGGVAVGKPVTRVVVGGPGPSIINVRAPGCWRFTLSWSGRSDTLDLLYRKRQER